MRNRAPGVRPDRAPCALRRLRRLFLDAARELLAEDDGELELRKVAERAGKSRTAPYLAFGKAEEGGGLPALLMAVAGEGFEELARAMRAPWSGQRAPAGPSRPWPLPTWPLPPSTRASSGSCSAPPCARPSMPGPWEPTPPASSGSSW
jgi:AcrR family transcriptional regulator